MTTGQQANTAAHTIVSFIADVAAFYGHVEVLAQLLAQNAATNPAAEMSRASNIEQLNALVVRFTHLGA